jgi:hypothetical protein
VAKTDERTKRQDSEQQDTEGQENESQDTEGQDTGEQESGEQESGEQESGEQESEEQQSGGGSLSAREAIRQAVEEISGLLGAEVHAVVGVERLEDLWLVTIEIIELERIPLTTSIVAAYQVDLDSSGELVAYRRVGRYVRGRTQEEG